VVKMEISMFNGHIFDYTELGSNLTFLTESSTGSDIENDETQTI